jgi:hypothetical protein
MSKKVNNKILLYILAGLLVAFGLVKLYQSRVTDNTLNPVIIEIDTNKVSKISIFPKVENGTEIKFHKDGKNWKLSNGKITCDPQEEVAQNLINILREVKPKHLASRNKDKWADFMLTDTLATRVKVYEGDKVTLDLLIGKFSYQKGNSQYGGMYGGGGTGTSYIRLYDEDEVYAIDGFLTYTFNQAFNNFRNQNIARVNKENLSKITFSYPADSSFNLTLSNNNWLVDGEKADSIKVLDFLNSLTFKNSSSFNDTYTPIGVAQYKLSVEEKNSKTITIEAYSLPNGEYAIKSSLNPKSIFTSNKEGIFKELFMPKENFLIGKKTNKKTK